MRDYSKYTPSDSNKYHNTHYSNVAGVATPSTHPEPLDKVSQVSRVIQEVNILQANLSDHGNLVKPPPCLPHKIKIPATEQEGA